MQEFQERNVFFDSTPQADVDDFCRCRDWCVEDYDLTVWQATTQSMASNGAPIAPTPTQLTTSVCVPCAQNQEQAEQSTDSLPPSSAAQQSPELPYNDWLWPEPTNCPPSLPAPCPQANTQLQAVKQMSPTEIVRASLEQQAIIDAVDNASGYEQELVQAHNSSR